MTEPSTPGSGELEGFSPETFARRRQAVMEAMGGGAMVLPAAPIRYRSADIEYRYRPDSELFWLTGLTEPDSVAVLRPFADEERFVLFVRPRDETAERWAGPRVGPERAGARYGADAAHALDEMEGRLPDLLADADRIHYRLGVHARTQALVVRALETSRTKGRRTGSGPRSVEDPGELLDPLRIRKDAEEIARIRQAAELTVRGFEEALASAVPGMGEWEVESVLEHAFRRGGARGPAFPTIVGSGQNACVLHYVENRDPLRPDQLCLVDAGAEVDLYAGDVTRTFPVSGSFSPEQREVYDVVLRAHRRVIAAVEPGVSMAELHRLSLETLVEGLVELGVLEGEVDALVEEEAYKPYFPHQTCHWLGLEVHDPGDYARDGEPLALEPGMVFTVEPGLYFAGSGGDPPSAADAADAEPAAPETPAGRAHPYTGIGVRMEDDILVTEEGCENLTASLPVDVEELEALVGSRAGGAGT